MESGSRAQHVFSKVSELLDAGDLEAAIGFVQGQTIGIKIYILRDSSLFLRVVIDVAEESIFELSRANNLIRSIKHEFETAARDAGFHADKISNALENAIVIGLVHTLDQSSSNTLAEGLEKLLNGASYSAHALKSALVDLDRLYSAITDEYGNPQVAPLDLGQVSLYVHLISTVLESLTKTSNFMVTGAPTNTAIGLETLTPEVLFLQLAPYLNSLVTLQSIISHINGEQLPEPTIKAITQNSPITISLSGVIEAINVARTIVVPWRRNHAEQMAKVELNKARVEWRLKELEYYEKESQLRDQSESDKTELERKRLENQQLRLELDREKLALEREQLALERERFEMYMAVIERYGKRLTEQERLFFLSKLKGPMDALAASPLEIAADE